MIIDLTTRFLKLEVFGSQIGLLYQQVDTVGDRSKIFLFVNFHLYKFYFDDLFPQHSPVKYRRKYRI